jgi:hypothetical protein
VLARSLAGAESDAAIIVTVSEIAHVLLDGEAPGADEVPLRAALNVLPQHAPESPEPQRGCALGVLDDA